MIVAVVDAIAAGRVAARFRAAHRSYGADEAYSQTEAGIDGPAPEPIILPGESLSKYRAGGGELPPALPRLCAVAVAPSAPGYEIPAGWDGGFVLPASRSHDVAHPEKQKMHRRASAEQWLSQVAEIEEAEVRSETATVPVATYRD